MKKNIRFIVNPFSGVGRKQSLPALVKQKLDLQKYDYEIVYTERPGHAITLAKEAVDQAFYMVVAVGGDGSVNEVASALIGSKTILGILPGGSGNGFAMYLGLGRSIGKAVEYLNTGGVVLLDSATLNGRPFVNLAGIGFDGWIAYKAKKDRLRGIWVYLKHVMLESWRYEPMSYEITVDGERITETCLVVEVANGGMFGYNFTVLPDAKLDDGLLDVLLIKKAPKWKYLLNSWRFLFNRIEGTPILKTYRGKEITVRPALHTAGHVDGEGFEVEGEVVFSVVPRSLYVWVAEGESFQ